jgi:integrase
MALTTKKIETLRQHPGRYLDGGRSGCGLYLQVTEGGASWLLRFELPAAPGAVNKKGLPYKDGRRERWLGLGSLRTFTLKQARARAKAKRELLEDGIDPLEQKKADKAAKALRDAKAITFAEAAQSFFNQHEKKWNNPKHRAQFMTTLKDYAFPKIGPLLVSDIDIGQVLRVIEPMWLTKTTTANRVRSRIEQVLDWATTRNARTGDNPARWQGHLSNVLPEPGKVQKIEHHPALPFKDNPEKGLVGIVGFMAALRKRSGTVARALEFTILTAARTGAVIGATKDEVDFQEKVWTVPPQRAGSKIGGDKPRRIPLSDRAIEILKALPAVDGNPYLFVGDKPGRGLPDAAMAALMVEMAFASTTPDRLATVHGFRSTFKDWISEETNYPNFVSEAALWHAVADKVEAAYRRGDLFVKRRKMMAEWARYCSTPQRSADVIGIRSRK